MEPQAYRQLAEIEDRHWWYRSRLKLIGQYIEKMRLPPGARILDIGCGTGGTTRFLQRYGQVTGVDRSALALEYAREKAAGVKLIAGDANRVAGMFRPQTFHLATIFNVLYHCWIEDDRAVLRQVGTLLRPGGFILLTEPAYRCLLREHDRRALGQRRYRLAEIRKLFAAAGIRYRGGRYFNALAFPVCLGMAIADKISGRAEDSQPAEITELLVPARAVNALLASCLELERRLFSLLPVPLGVTILAWGQKA